MNRLVTILKQIFVGLDQIILNLNYPNVSRIYNNFN